jgi:hypothetical protein
MCAEGSGAPHHLTADDDDDSHRAGRLRLTCVMSEARRGEEMTYRGWGMCCWRAMIGRGARGRQGQDKCCEDCGARGS